MVERLVKIMAAVLELPESEVNESLTMEECVSWTSLALVIMLEKLENEFGIEFDVEDAIEMDSFVAIKEILEQKGVQ